MEISAPSPAPGLRRGRKNIGIKQKSAQTGRKKEKVMKYAPDMAYLMATMEKLINTPSPTG